MLKRISLLLIAIATIFSMTLAFGSGAYISLSRGARSGRGYTKGKEIAHGKKRQKGVPNCSTCHKGNLSFKRGRLLAIKNQLPSKVGCGVSAHRSFCRSLTRAQINSLVAYLRRRYRL